MSVFVIINDEDSECVVYCDSAFDVEVQFTWSPFL